MILSWSWRSRCRWWREGWGAWRRRRWQCRCRWRRMEPAIDRPSRCRRRSQASGLLRPSRCHRTRGVPMPCLTCRRPWWCRAPMTRPPRHHPRRLQAPATPCSPTPLSCPPSPPACRSRGPGVTEAGPRRGRSGGRAGVPGRGEVAAHSEVGGVLDQGAVEGDAEGALDQFAGLQRDEGVPGEQAGAYGRPLRFAGRVVEVDLVDRADLGAGAVERLAADQVARIDIGLHGPSSWSQLIRKHYKRAHWGRWPLESSASTRAGRLANGC